MPAALKILKINFLSLVALPLLLLTIGIQLVSKALGKIRVFAVVLVAILGLYFLGMLFSEYNLMLIQLIVLMAVITGVLLLLFGWLLRLGAGFFVLLVSLLKKGLSLIFNACHSGYAALYDICKTDYAEFADQPGKIHFRWACPIWNLLRALNFGIVKLLSAAFPLSIAACAALYGYVLFWAHSKVSSTFGIGLFSYLKLFPAKTLVFFTLYSVVLLAAAAVILISLGSEWAELGTLLDLSTLDYSSYKRAMQQQATEIGDNDLSDLSFENGQSSERCRQYIETLNGMVDDFDGLQQQVDTAMQVHSDPSVAYQFGEYASLLSNLTKKLSNSLSSLTCDQFEKQFIPSIDEAQQMMKQLQKTTVQIINRAGGSESSPLDFFAGCASKEEVRKRYLSLSKIYHPDAGGPEEIFKMLQNQYEKKMGETPVET